MLTLYGVGANGLTPLPVPADDGVPPNVVWLDLVSPTREEEHAVQRWLDIEVPTREEMKEIEVSSRVYEERGSLYLTTTVIVHADSAEPETTEVTFILSHGRIVTVRYVEPRPFMMYVQKINKQLVTCQRGEQVLIGLLDAMVDRLADLLERADGEVDAVSKLIFRRGPKARKSRSRSGDLNLMVGRIGQTADLASKVRESLVTIGRVVTFVAGADGLLADKLPKDVRAHLKTTNRDVAQLTDHAGYLSNKIGFLLDAVTGLITIEQNNIIKIFSIVSVMLMPPTLVASIYGMNFQFMPELAQTWGYPAALVAMVISAIIPYVYFRSRGWL